MFEWIAITCSRRKQRQLLGDRGSPIAALCDELIVSEPRHQHGPGFCDAYRIPAERFRLRRKSISRYRRNHQVERIRRTRAVRRGIRQEIDDFHLLDDGTGPAVRHDERQCIVDVSTERE